MQKTRKTYYANGTDIGDAMIHHGIYYLNGAEATTQDWTGKPSDWSDIRKDCPANSIALYSGHTADYSQYDNLGFTVTISNSGKYKVFIDGTQYGDEYDSGSTCNITWSTLGITTGDDITTPSALKAHKIWIEPATAGNNITAFHCARVAASGNEYQGLLWTHFNISNQINLQYGISRISTYEQRILRAITAKNNTLKVSNIVGVCGNARSLEYVPVFDGQNSVSALDSSFYYTKLKEITFNNISFSSMPASFYSSPQLKKVKGSFTTKNTCANYNDTFNNCVLLEEFNITNFNFDAAYGMYSFITNTTKLKDIVLNIPSTDTRRIGCFGNNIHFMSGFKGLRVSNEAPFTGGAPQINVQYTGMDRNALVQLFNDLPYNVGYEVVGSPTISDGVVSGFSSSNYVKTSSALDVLASANTFEKKICFTVASTPDTAHMICQYGQTGGTFLLAAFRQEDNNFRVRWYVNDSSNIFVALPTNDLAFNTRYYLILKFTGTQYKMLLSTDDQNYTEIYNFDSTAKIGASSTYKEMAYGVDQRTIWSPLNGSIDLNNTYIKVNDVYWFKGQPARVDKPELNCKGCTGALDLTEADRDIAEKEKNWKLTYQ